MDNFLTTLYYKRFSITERQKKLMENHPKDRDANIRNDQSISETSMQVVVIDELITAYIKQIKE